MGVNKIIYGGKTLVDLTSDTVTAADLADGVKATGADGNPIVGLMQKVTIDAELSTTSTNPVQNKVIAEAIANIGSGGSGGVSTSEANTWPAAQTFNSISKYKKVTLAMLGFNISPTTPSIFILAKSNITINLDALCAQVAEGESMIFRAYILCTDDGKQYTLTIEHTEGAVFITGDYTDYAISKLCIILTAYIARVSGIDDPFVILSATKIKGMLL